MSSIFLIKNNSVKRKRRVRLSLRKKSRGRLRLSVFRSNCHFYAQIIDDQKGITLVSASTLEEEIKKEISQSKGFSNAVAAKAVGKVIALRALSKNIQEVVFDRGSYIYHGRIAALADSARENGLRF